jgi:hypothetical protein
MPADAVKSHQVLLNGAVGRSSRPPPTAGSFTSSRKARAPAFDLLVVAGDLQDAFSDAGSHRIA